MARIHLFLIAATVVLLGACAEIIPLSGGNKDEFAPAPVRQEPGQGTTHFSGNSVRLTFDEYLRLNDPANTITMNPSVGKLTTGLKNRTVSISWEEPLKANTTYILQLNGAIRDINEGNDSIMQVVFATGAVIDSLRFEGRIVNAYTHQAMNQVSVGLYAPGSDPFAVKPVYATRSDAKGLFRFSYLKNEPYAVFAFEDRNKDQLPQVNETIGFLDSTVSVTDSASVIVSMFAPVPVRNQLKTQFVPPGLMLAYNLEGVHAERMTVNGQPVELVEQYAPDSILVTLPASEDANYRIVYGEDSLTKPLIGTERMIGLAIKPYDQNGKWQAGDSLRFRVDDRIRDIRQEAITVTNDKGTPVKYELVRGKRDWSIVPDKETDRSFRIRFDKNAVSGTFGQSDSATFRYETLLKADLSNLKLNCPDFGGDQWIIELVQKEKTIYSAIKPAGAAVVEFHDIMPGEYGVRCIRDVNRNGKWDTGSYVSGTQPEEVLRYTLTQKLRANWDIEETLEKKP